MMINDQTYQRVQKVCYNDADSFFLIRTTEILFASWPLILKFNQYLRIGIRYQAISTAQREEIYCPSPGYLEPKWFLELKGFSSHLFL